MTEAIINVSVANIYETHEYQSQIVTQAILGEPVKVHERSQNFSLVELPDTYTGWVSNYQLSQSDGHRSPETVTVREHWIQIYRDPDIRSQIVRDAVIGTQLDKAGSDGDWIEIRLPDGDPGWIGRSVLGKFPNADRQGVTSLAGEFLGYPYFWGGRSPKGFDCSGLTQTVYRLLGIRIPRDSWMQQKAGKPVANVLPGDLYFFSEAGDRITHVGIALGDGRILHARGHVRINSLIEGTPGYNAELKSTLVDARSFFER